MKLQNKLLSLAMVVGAVGALSLAQPQSASAYGHRYWGHRGYGYAPMTVVNPYVAPMPMGAYPYGYNYGYVRHPFLRSLFGGWGGGYRYW